MDISEDEENIHEEVTREESLEETLKHPQDQSKRIIMKTKSLEVGEPEYKQGDNYCIKQKQPAYHRLSPHQSKTPVKMRTGSKP